MLPDLLTGILLSGPNGLLTTNVRIALLVPQLRHRVNTDSSSIASEKTRARKGEGGIRLTPPLDHKGPAMADGRRKLWINWTIEPQGTSDLRWAAIALDQNGP